MTLEASDPRPAIPHIALDDTLIELLPVAVYVCAADGTIRLYNRRAVELWGRRPKIGDSDQKFCGALRLYWPDGRPLPHHETPMAAALHDGAVTRDQEVCIERPDGERITASVNISPLRDKSGRITGAVNCFQDITERKRQEARVQESERGARELLDALPAAVYTTDAEGWLSFYNRAAAKFWGYEPELGKVRWCGSHRLYAPNGEPLPLDQCPMAIALKERRPVREVEAIAERPDGERIPFMPFPTPLFDAEGRLKGAVNMLVDISFQKRAQSRQQVLINELNHRVKNSLATVQSIAHQTLRGAATPEAFHENFSQRLMALSRAHDLLTEAGWEGADLRALLMTVLGPHEGEGADRVRLSGEAVALSPRVALSLGMALHELATNAAKYGALTSPDGVVEIGWTIAGAGERIVMEWVERGGPPVTPPSRRGFGARLLELTLSGELGGQAQMDFSPEGLCCRMEFSTGAAGA